MSHSPVDPALPAFIDRVVQTGSHYDLARMPDLYTPDMAILFLTRDGGCVRSPLESVLAEFRDRGERGEPPLSTEYRILHLEQQEDAATAVLYRRMGPESQAAVYELRLRRDEGRWRVCGETVTPWPDLDKAGDFLPARVAS